MILTPQDKKFINFHAHTSLSVQDALTTPEDLVLGAKALGHESCCVSEHGHMASFPLFVKACDKHGINFRLATEFYFQWDHQKKDKMSHHLLVIVKDEIGYQNMLRLQHWSNVKVDEGGGYYGRPRITEKMLELHKEGLIVSSACLSGPVTYHLHRNDEMQATLAAEYFRDNFDHFYLELMPHRLDVQGVVNPKIVALGKKLSIPVITTLDVHFKDKSYENAYLANGDIRRNRTISDRQNPEIDCLRDPDFWYKSPEEIIEIYDEQGIDRISAIETFKNTLDLDRLITFSWQERHFDFPVFCEDADKVLLKMLREKAAKKFNGQIPDEVRNRANEEYQVIKKMGYSNYFLILNDAMEFCDSNNIARGAGRGSAGACMVLYILGITKINPLEYNLAFSRFLNEYRKSAPDVDLDLQPVGREALIQYLQRKYGKDRIVQVVNYSEMRPKAAIKDACKWMEVDFKIANEITSHIPSKEYDEEGNLVDLDWDDAMAHVPEETKREHHDVLDIAEKLAGSYRTFGKHAGAVCVLPRKATEIIPVMKGKDDDGVNCLVSQWDKNILDSVGVHKYDLLGLSTLTVLKECEKLTGIKEDDIPLDDEKTWKFIRDAKFMFGVFQMAEDKTKRFIRDVMPSNISELADINTLIRPGSDSTTYLANKASGNTTFKFDVPEVREELSRTYGAIIYQESIINLASKLSGLDLGEGDLMRRAFEKADKEKIELYRKKFMETAKYPDQAEEMFEWLLESAGYLFCIHEDSIATLADGRKIAVKDTLPGDIFLSYDAQGRTVENVSLGYVSKGTKECLKITTECGKEIICTPDHEIYSVGIRQKAGELEIGDSVSVLNEGGLAESQIASIESVGECNVGDISLLFHPNNFICNDILVKQCSPHCIAYSMISYYTAFYKANYPAEFLIANLRHPKSGAKFTESEYMGEFIQEAVQMGISINLPTLEKMFISAAPENGEVYLGIDMLKGFSQKTSSVIANCLDCKTFEEFVEKATSFKEKTAKVKLDGNPTFKTTITKAHILTLIDIGFFGDPEEALTKYVAHYKLKEKDWPEKKSRIEGINKAFGFELYSRCYELWHGMRHKMKNPHEYKVLKVETTKVGKGQYGDYTMVKADSNTGKLTAFFKGANKFNKGDFVLVKFKAKQGDGSTINVFNHKVMEV